MRLEDALDRRLTGLDDRDCSQVCGGCRGITTTKVGKKPSESTELVDSGGKSNAKRTRRCEEGFGVGKDHPVAANGDTDG